MLGTPFTHDMIRKYVVSFGTLFNNIKLQRIGVTDTQWISVPLSYAPKEKWHARLTDPRIAQQIAISLPRISYELVTATYAPDRKMNTMNKHSAVHTADQNKLWTMFAPVPYDFQFSLYIYSRNAADASNIIEQILPFFTPEFTVSIKDATDLKIDIDCPIILNSVNREDTYEGDFESRRVVTWSLDFTMKGLLFGPVREEGVIKKAFIDFYIPSSQLLHTGNAVSLDISVGANNWVQTDISQFSNNSQLNYGFIKRSTTGNYIPVGYSNWEEDAALYSNTGANVLYSLDLANANTGVHSSFQDIYTWDDNTNQPAGKSNVYIDNTTAKSGTSSLAMSHSWPVRPAFGGAALVMRGLNIPSIVTFANTKYLGAGIDTLPVGLPFNANNEIHLAYAQWSEDPNLYSNTGTARYSMDIEDGIAGSSPDGEGLVAIDNRIYGVANVSIDNTTSKYGTASLKFSQPWDSTANTQEGLQTVQWEGSNDYESLLTPGYIILANTQQSNTNFLLPSVDTWKNYGIPLDGGRFADGLRTGVERKWILSFWWKVNYLEVKDGAGAWEQRVRPGAPVPTANLSMNMFVANTVGNEDVNDFAPGHAAWTSNGSMGLQGGTWSDLTTIPRNYKMPRFKAQAIDTWQRDSVIFDFQTAGNWSADPDDLLSNRDYTSQPWQMKRRRIRWVIPWIEFTRHSSHAGFANNYIPAGYSNFSEDSSLYSIQVDPDNVRYPINFDPSLTFAPQVSLTSASFEGIAATPTTLNSNTGTHSIKFGMSDDNTGTSAFNKIPSFLWFANAHSFGSAAHGDGETPEEYSIWHYPHDSYTWEKYGIQIPKGKKWILSWYWKTNREHTADPTGQVVAGADASDWTYKANVSMDMFVANDSVTTDHTHAYWTYEGMKFNDGPPYQPAFIGDYAMPRFGPDANNTWQRNHITYDFTTGTLIAGEIPGGTATQTYDAWSEQDVDTQNDPPLWDYRGIHMVKSQISRIIPWIQYGRTSVEDDFAGHAYWFDGIQFEMVGDENSTWATEPSDYIGDFKNVEDYSNFEYHIDGIQFEEYDPTTAGAPSVPTDFGTRREDPFVLPEDSDTWEQYGIDIPTGKKWILSWYWKVNSLTVADYGGMSGSGDGGPATANLSMDMFVANASVISDATHAFWTDEGMMGLQGELEEGEPGYDPPWGVTQIYNTQMPKFKAAAADTWQQNYITLDFTSGVYSNILGNDGNPASRTNPANDQRNLEHYAENFYMDKTQISKVIPMIQFGRHEITDTDYDNLEYHIDGIKLEMAGDGDSTWATEPGEGAGYAELITDQDRDTTEPIVISSNRTILDLSDAAPVRFMGSSQSLRVGGDSAEYRPIVFANTYLIDGSDSEGPDKGTFTKYGIPIEPGKKWRLSWYMSTGTKFGPEHAGAYTCDMSQGSPTVLSQSISVTDWERITIDPVLNSGGSSWTRHYVDLDFTAGNYVTHNSLILQLSPTHTDTFYVNGILLEDITSSSATGPGILPVITNQIKLVSTASNKNNYYKKGKITIKSGTLAGNTATVTYYEGKSRIAVITPTFAETPDTTTQYELEYKNPDYDGPISTKDQATTAASRVTTQPGLTAEGQSTGNVFFSVDVANIDASDDFGVIETRTFFPEGLYPRAPVSSVAWNFTSDNGGWVSLRRNLIDCVGQPIRQWTGGTSGVAGVEGTWDGTYDTEGEPNYTNPKFTCSGPRFHPDSGDPTKSVMSYTKELQTGGAQAKAEATAYIVTQATDDDGVPGSTADLQPKDFVKIPNTYAYEGDWTLDGKRFAFSRHANNNPTDQTLTGADQATFPWRQAAADIHGNQRGSMSDIWVFDESPVIGTVSDGTNSRRISSQDLTGDGQPNAWWRNQVTWDPTGKHVVVYIDSAQNPETNIYQQEDPHKEGNHINSRYSVWILNVDGPSASGLTDPPSTLSNGTGFSQYPVTNTHPWSSEYGVHMNSFGTAMVYEDFGPDASANNRYVLTHNEGDLSGLANSTPSSLTWPGGGGSYYGPHSGKYTELRAMGGSDLIVMGYEGNAGAWYGGTTGPAAGTANIAQLSCNEVLTANSLGHRTTTPVFWSHKGIIDTNCRMTDGSPTVSVSTDTATAVAEWLARENYSTASGTIDAPSSPTSGVARTRPLVIGDGILDHTFCKTVDLEAIPPTIQLVDYADVAVNATKTVGDPDYATLKIGGDYDQWGSTNPDGTCFTYIKGYIQAGPNDDDGGPQAAPGGINETAVHVPSETGVVGDYDGTGAFVLTGDGQPEHDAGRASPPDFSPGGLEGGTWWGPGNEISWETKKNIFSRKINSHFNGRAGTTVERNPVTNALKVTGIGGEGLATTERFHGIIHSDNALGSENATRMIIDTDIYQTIQVRMKLTKEWRSMNINTEEFTGSGWYGRLYWSTSRDDYFTQTRSIDIPEPTWGTDYIDLSWPVSTSAAWTGTVDKIKFVFNKIEMWHKWYPLGEYEIDSIICS